MKLSAYLSSSRHGVYFVRWPLPVVEDQGRSTDSSLKTKCPDLQDQGGKASDVERSFPSDILRGHDRILRTTRMGNAVSHACFVDLSFVGHA